MKLNETQIKNATASYVKDRLPELTAHQGIFAQAISGAPLPSHMQANDAAQGMAFFVSQLAHTEAGVYLRQYTPMQYQLFVPVSNEAGEYAEQVRYQTMDNVGMGRRASSKPDDINLVDVTMSEKVMSVNPGDIGYHYTQQELIQSAYYRRPLSDLRMVAALEGFQRHMNKVALMGEGADAQGLFNHSSVPRGNAPTGTWATATPDSILNDLDALLLAVYNASSNNDVPDTVLLPPTQYSRIQSTPRSPNSDMTILEYFKMNNLFKGVTGGQITVAPAFGLQGMGTSGVDRAVAYTNRNDRLVMHIPMPLKFLAPQFRGQHVYVPGMYRYSGLEVRYPKSMRYMEGV